MAAHSYALAIFLVIIVFRNFPNKPAQKIKVATNTAILAPSCAYFCTNIAETLHDITPDIKKKTLPVPHNAAKIAAR